ncbi:hypothetical protein PSTG_08004 [Puccinia striiformis f. sp. tritici PST-78]|uniref:Uncharacterized protein n=1 Tax=Puccinia striiformis f. sp. tritici PST-78 TaxID=1165861 RepID=A0A0L0VH81_9BASI|nr:hypothetical protein PSTG_08004 [Puccinia striiformis f. sp. tritici PST-78]
MSNDADSNISPTNPTKDTPTHFPVSIGSSWCQPHHPHSPSRDYQFSSLRAQSQIISTGRWLSTRCSKGEIKICTHLHGHQTTTGHREDDNDTVCSMIMQIVDPLNLCYIQETPDNAAGMWSTLLRAHQDSSTGGKVYWMRKLVNPRMEGDDISAHIDPLVKFHRQLNTLVTPGKPLTPDNVHIVALLSSIPPDWIHCVLGLMNQEGVKSETIVSALKNESIRRESQGNIISVLSTLAKSNPFKAKSNQDRHHPVNSMAEQKACWEASHKESPTPSTKTPAQAGRTSAATLVL